LYIAGTYLTGKPLVHGINTLGLSIKDNVRTVG
jgi:hypothetical protein